MFCFFTKSFGTGIVLLVAGLALCHGQGVVVGQWDVLAGGMEAGTNGVTRWVSPQNTILEFFSSQWVEADGALRNLGGVAGSGLKPEHDSSTNKTVRAGVLLVRPTAPFRAGAALYIGHHTARLADFPNGGLEGEWDAVGPSDGVRVFVNGVESAPLQVGEWQIVSFVAPDEMPLERGMVFADPFLAWKMGFLGDTRCVVLLGGGTVGEAALRGMESALALRHKVAGIRSATAPERKAAQNTGFSAHGVWATLFLVR